MKLSDLRSQYPEYRDMDDEDLLESIHEAAYPDLSYDEFLGVVVDKPKPDKAVITLQEILSALDGLHDAIVKMDKNSVASTAPDYRTQFTELNTSIQSLAKYIDDIKPPVVNVEAPIVNVKPPVVNVEAPVIETPIVNVPKQDIIIPTQVKEWDFKVKRDSNGYIQGVTATAKGDK